MSRFIQAILFDLGDTLMHSRAAWPPVFERAGQALADSLHTSGVDVNRNTFPKEFHQRLEKYYTDRDHNLFERTSQAVLQELLDEKGLAHIPEASLRRALDDFYAVTQTNWALEEDAIAMLDVLQNGGYRLGLVSNASDNRDVFTLADQFGIEQYFDFILTSAACSYRKPHPRIFELALAHWGYLPDEIAMVGDRLDADIGGARPLGIFTIWIKRRAKRLEPPPAHPDADVETLSEIPPLLLSLIK
jgi:HAD superfamily hydrolase (TIGR01549 family)